MKTEEFFLEPNFPGEYQALGLVQGVWFPRASKATTGWLLCDRGCSQIESTLMRDVKEFVYSYSDISQTLNYFNVYPRTVNGQLNFQVKFLHNSNAANWKDWHQQLEANADRFRLRGAIRSLKKDGLVMHIQQNVKPGRTPNIQFEVEVKGEVDSLAVGQFVEVFAQRTGYALEVESVELMEDVRVPSIAWAR
jgi:hypothetical protein